MMCLCCIDNSPKIAVRGRKIRPLPEHLRVFVYGLGIAPLLVVDERKVEMCGDELWVQIA